MIRPQARSVRGRPKSGFVHFAIDETDDGHNPLNDLSAFGAFQEHIGDRCDEPPVVSELRRVRSYRLGVDD
jgi:hypothetical protein